MEQAKLLSMTGILTLLIWVSADSLVNETGSVRVGFEVVAPDGSGILVEIAPGAGSQSFEVEIFGPRKTVEEVQAREQPLIVRLPVAERPTGQATLSLDKDALKRRMEERWSEFRRLRVVSIQPDTLPIIVDRMVAKPLEITMKRLTLAYDDQPQLRLASTLVRMRESEYGKLTASGERLQIDIAAEVERLLRGKPAGQNVTVSVPLDARAFGRDAELIPDRVEVTAAVKADRQTVEVPTVPIKPVVSFANLAKQYLAVARDGTPLTLVTQTVKVTGPTDDVARLLRGETRAYGFIQLKEADLEELDVYKAWTPELHLPPRIELAEDPKAIEFKLIIDSGADSER